MATLPDALRELADGGHVFPLRPRTKVPFGEHVCPSGHSHEHGLLDATNDPQVVRVWWAAHPDADLGVNCERSGEVLIDFDPRGDLEGIALEELRERLNELPPTRVVLTGGGGTHTIFRANGTRYRSGPTDIPGIEIKCAGGYRVAAGSRHPSGGVYLFDEATAELPLADCPDLSPILTSRATTGTAAPLPDLLNQGHRRPGMTRIAGAMRRQGCEPAEILAALRVANDARCRPPLEDRHLVAIADGIAKRYAPEPAETWEPFTSEAADATTGSSPLPNGVRVIGADEVQSARVSYLPGCAPYVARGMVTILVGPPGLGKSQETIRLAATNPGITLILTAEDNLEAVVRPRLEAAGAELGRVRIVVMRRDGVDGTIVLPDDNTALDRVVAQHEATLVVVDPVLAHLSGAVDSHRDHDVRRVLAPLHRLAEASACAVVAVMHVNKRDSRDVLSRIGASIGFQGAARSILLLARDPKDPEGERGSLRVLAHVKCNYAPLGPSLAMRVEPAIVIGADNERIETSRLIVTGESDMQGSDLLVSADDANDQRAHRPERDEAAEFLRQELAGGPRLTEEVKAQAAKLGISAATLRRAREEIGVRPERDGFGKDGTWSWRLP